MVKIGPKCGGVSKKIPPSGWDNMAQIGAAPTMMGLDHFYLSWKRTSGGSPDLIIHDRLARAQYARCVVIISRVSKQL